MTKRKHARVPHRYAGADQSLCDFRSALIQPLQIVDIHAADPIHIGGGLEGLNRPLSSRQVKKEKLCHEGLVPVSKGSQTL